jgi:hypothetical protein
MLAARLVLALLPLFAQAASAPAPQAAQPASPQATPQSSPQATSQSSAQAAVQTAPRVVHFTSDRLTMLASPDDEWTLANGCHGCPAGRVLWLANNADHHRRIVRKYEHTVTAGWSADSASFFLNDEPEDGATRAYVIEAATLKVTEVEKLVAAGDSDAPAFLHAGRAALAVERWLAPGELSVALTGRFEQPAPTEFVLRYRVKLGGGVRRVSARQWDADAGPPPE